MLSGNSLLPLNGSPSSHIFDSEKPVISLFSPSTSLRKTKALDIPISGSFFERANPISLKDSAFTNSAPKALYALFLADKVMFFDAVTLADCSIIISCRRSISSEGSSLPPSRIRAHLIIEKNSFIVPPCFRYLQHISS